MCPPLRLPQTWRQCTLGSCRRARVWSGIQLLCCAQAGSEMASHSSGVSARAASPTGWEESLGGPGAGDSVPTRRAGPRFIGGRRRSGLPDGAAHAPRIVVVGRVPGQHIADKRPRCHAPLRLFQAHQCCATPDMSHRIKCKGSVHRAKRGLHRASHHWSLLSGSACAGRV